MSKDTEELEALLKKATPGPWEEEKFAKDVLQYREENSCSVFEAGAAIRRRRLHQEIDRAQSLEDVKIILHKLVK